MLAWKAMKTHSFDLILIVKNGVLHETLFSENVWAFLNILHEMVFFLLLIGLKYAGLSRKKAMPCTSGHP